MYYLNKIALALFNPFGFTVALLVFLLVLSFITPRRIGIGRFSVEVGQRFMRTVLAFTIAWLWLWSSGAWYRIIGTALEREYPSQPVETLPDADIVVVLGGGMWASTNGATAYADMNSAADRIWHASRIYRELAKRSKPPKVVLSGNQSRLSSVPLIMELGVPECDIIVDDESRNTEENALFSSAELDKLPSPSSERRALLVTSAWHMRRALLVFRRYAPQIETIPAPTDHEALQSDSYPLSIADFLPSAEAAMRNAYIYKEYLGYWGYRLLRR